MINLNSPIQTHRYMATALSSIESKTYDVRRKTLSHKIEVGMNSLAFLIIAFVAIISFIFLIHSNKNATKGYALKNLEVKRSQLMTENEVWDMQIAQVKSLQAIQSDPKILSMVKADQPQFVRGDTAVASR